MIVAQHHALWASGHDLRRIQRVCHRDLKPRLPDAEPVVAPPLLLQAYVRVLHFRPHRVEVHGHVSESQPRAHLQLQQRRQPRHLVLS